MSNKISAGMSNNININPIFTNVSPIKKQYLISTVKTKVVAPKTFRNTSDMGNYSRDKNATATDKRKKNFSKSIDSKNNEDYNVTTTNNFPLKTVTKSPLSLHHYKIK